MEPGIQHAFFFTPPVETNFIGHIMAEIYKDQVYAPYLAGKKDLVIFDIGANIGIATYYFSQFAKHIYSFEPAAEHYRNLVTMIANNKLQDKVTAIPQGISTIDGEASFYHNPNKTMFSLRPAVVSGDIEMIKTTRLDTFMKENKIEHIDFMKLDIEGSEADVVCHEGFQNIASCIDMMVIEQHSWMGRNPSQLKDGLEMAGFTVSQIPNDATLLVAKRI